MSLFTGTYSSPLQSSADPLMQAALDASKAALAAVGTSNVDRLALMVVSLGGHTSALHPWAGLRELEEHYSASLIKVAALYAAVDLRASAEQLRAAQGLIDWPSLEAALVAEWTPEILAHVPALISNAASLTPALKTRMPAYSDVLQLVPDGAGGVEVGFTARALAAFDNMIAGAHNPGATSTIHDLGYGYLNGKIADDGFFDGTGQGIWLAGDYASVWPYVRIPSVNDAGVAQATTAWHMALLLTLMCDGRLVGPQSSAEMLGQLQRAAGWFGFAQPPIWSPAGNLTATASKVGVGPLKTGQLVFSEGIVVHDAARDLQFVVVWQNVIGQQQPNGRPTQGTLRPVATLIEAAIAAFVPG